MLFSRWTTPEYGISQYITNLGENLNEVIVTHFDEVVKNEIEKMYSENLKIWFNFESISIDDVRNIVAESYIKESKRIFIETKQFNHVAQNGLLKILEEPPDGVSFTLIVPSKSILLPTIRSRMGIRYIKNRDRTPPNIEIPNLENIDIEKLNKILEQVKKLDREEAKKGVEAIFRENIEYSWNSEDLERFSIATRLLSLGSSGVRVYLMLLLPFVNRKK